MQELEKRLDILETDFLGVYEKLKIDEKLEQIAKLEKEVAEPEIWRNVEEATSKNQKLAALTDETRPFLLIHIALLSIRQLVRV